ncbi:MAG TPA: type II toxin-antitoxin system RelE/ParE family toxin [Rhodocyclaceae bacterium]|nr:type II toxin-antitoxin system RelE/ParE family toxin [Rhodocyclaceae bacterium]
MISIRLHPAARWEVRRAFEWYLQEAGAHIASGFLDDFEQTLALLKSHPTLGEPSSNDTRRLIFHRYPYTVVYRLRDKALEIVAIAHHSRQPEYWTSRL